MSCPQRTPMDSMVKPRNTNDGKDRTTASVLGGIKSVRSLSTGRECPKGVQSHTERIDMKNTTKQLLTRCSGVIKSFMNVPVGNDWAEDDQELCITSGFVLRDIEIALEPKLPKRVATVAQLNPHVCATCFDVVHLPTFKDGFEFHCPNCYSMCRI